MGQSLLLVWHLYWVPGWRTVLAARNKPGIITKPTATAKRGG